MPSPSSNKVAIINRALAHIKVGMITSLDESSEPARQANLFYDCVRESALRSCDWRFATVKKPLVKLGDIQTALDNPTDQSKQDVSPQWSFLYAYPVQCQRVRRVFNTQESDLFPQWDDRTMADAAVKIPPFEECRSPVTNQLAIATNLEGAWAEYTFDINDDSQFDSMFQDAMSWLLAQELCIPLTGDKELKQSVDKDTRACLDEAKRKNGGEGVEMAPRISNYESARSGYEKSY